MRDVLDDLIAHATLPKLLEVIGNTGHGLFLRIAGKE